MIPEDEPEGLFRILDYYNRGLLGAVLVRPTEIFGAEVSKLGTELVRSEVLAVVLETYRECPAIGARDLSERLIGIEGAVWEIVSAIEAAVPWNAQFYARQIRRIETSRRKYWKALRAVHKLRANMLREI